MADNEVGRELKDHLGKIVEVKGEVLLSDEEQEESENPTIVITSFRSVEQPTSDI